MKLFFCDLKPNVQTFIGTDFVAPTIEDNLQLKSRNVISLICSVRCS